MKFSNSPRWTGDLYLARRASRVRTCSSKQFHRTQGAAEAHMRALERRFGHQTESLRVYKCRICGGWHLGRLRPLAGLEVEERG